MKNILFIILFLTQIRVFPQRIKDLTFYTGVKLRVTPIHNKNSLNQIIIIPGNINAFQQPDLHISGFGLYTTQTIKLNKLWLINFQQTTRYDLLYQERPLEINSEGTKNIKRLIFDLNLDIGRRFVTKKSELTALFGLGISGLNTGYTQIIRQYSTPTNFIDFKEEKNFLFPTASAGFGWQKGKFLTQIKMGYCWQSPTWLTYPFFFPELSVQYKIK